MSVRIFIGPDKKLDATNGYEMLFTFSIHERKPSRNCGTWPVVASASEPKFRRGGNKDPTSSAAVSAAVVRASRPHWRAQAALATARKMPEVHTSCRAV